MTPHIEANKEDIASTVIITGDPKRVEYIANNYLTNTKVVNTVRGELAITGYYKDKRLTVFSCGMGIPSMGIYSHELYKFYDVENIIRVGSAGSYTKELKLNDIFLVTSSYTDSNYAKAYCDSIEKIVYSSNELNDIILNKAKELNMIVKEGRCETTESFYNEILDIDKLVNTYNCECVEMETFSLFLNALNLNKKASALLTISDQFITNERLNIESREVGFNNMIKLALESTLDIKKN